MDKDPPAEAAKQQGAALVGIAEQLGRELKLRPRSSRRERLDVSLGRDWGFDSLSRAELLLRVERAFSVTLPTQLLQQAETLRDVLAALDRAATPREAVSARFEPISRTQAEPAPAEAAILTEVLDWHVSKHGNRTHVVLAQGDGQDVALSYEALARRSRAVAGGLRQRGVETGDRVAIMLPTSLEFFQAFFGALYACAVPTPIYPPVRPSQLAEHLTRQAGILRNAGAKPLVTARKPPAWRRCSGFKSKPCRACRP